ncbi:MAG TPA: CD225/dispanin family protein [Terriglobales bacterium]|nr:CD225/dispanin family protein [Terriglobales bacterium]
MAVIYCQQCGTQNDTLATVCGQCGTPLRATATPTTPAAPPAAAGTTAAKVENYLVPAILVTVCCCLPLGIPAIIYAAQVNTKLQAGDLAGAQASSRSARTWCLVAGIAGAAGVVVYAMLAVVGAMMER